MTDRLVIRAIARGDFALLNISEKNSTSGVLEYEPVNGPMSLSLDELDALAAAYVGRWAGDRIAVVGDYMDDVDRRDGVLPLFIKRRPPDVVVVPFNEANCLLTITVHDKTTTEAVDPLDPRGTDRCSGR